MRGKPTVLKLGGSVVTLKEKRCTSNERAIMRLASEIERANINSLLIIHGGGSFGHPIAKEYGLKKGYEAPFQTIGFSKTHQAMISLNKMILDALIHEGIPAVTVQPSGFITTHNGRIRCVETKILLKLLELGLMPVLYGDVVMDSVLGFTVLSGDQLASALAMKLGADRIILGIDVDGLYTADPKIDSSARLIKRISLRELEDHQLEIGEATVPDVTRGMFGKIFELIPAVAQGITAIIVNAATPNNVYRALRDEKFVGTIIEAGETVA